MKSEIMSRFFSGFTIIPKTINIDNRFLSALSIYVCEGRNPVKGIYSSYSGNKGRDLSISNSDFRIIKIVIDEFESKLGIDRTKWAIWLNLFDWQNVDKEKKWWSRKLEVPLQRIRTKNVLKGDGNKKTYAPHGRCAAEVYSSIYATVLHNLCQKFLDCELFKLNT